MESSMEHGAWKHGSMEHGASTMHVVKCDANTVRSFKVKVFRVLRVLRVLSGSSGSSG